MGHLSPLASSSATRYAKCYGPRFSCFIISSCTHLLTPSLVHKVAQESYLLMVVYTELVEYTLLARIHAASHQAQGKHVRLSHEVRDISRLSPSSAVRSRTDFENPYSCFVVSIRTRLLARYFVHNCTKKLLSLLRYACCRTLLWRAQTASQQAHGRPDRRSGNREAISSRLSSSVAARNTAGYVPHFRVFGQLPPDALFTRLHRWTHTLVVWGTLVGDTLLTAESTHRITKILRDTSHTLA